jgi:hypothetical protein
MLTLDEAKRLLVYSPETGRVQWRVSSERGGRMISGNDLGSISKGYKIAEISGCTYRVHRLAWLLHYGVWPKGDIDHINGNRSDNRIDNLREATRSLNLAIRGATKRNTSGFKGVSWDKKKRKWVAQISKDYKRQWFSRHDTPEAAHAAYTAAAKVMFGEYARSA